MSHIVIHTGGDPRQLAEFEAIRLEINKISHPAQPEVNWAIIESQALAIFRSNGVDLQTTAYYTLARARLAGLAGFTEGCELLAGVITAEWERCWPDNETARIEILDWFNAKAGNVLRTLPFEEKDLRLLYRAERALQLISDKLQQVPLRRIPKVENLLIFVQNTGRRVEQEKQQANLAGDRVPTETLVWVAGPEQRYETVSVVTEPETTTPVPDAEKLPEQPKVTVAQPVPPARKRGWLSGFSSGVVCSLLLAALAFYFCVLPMKKQLEDIARHPLGASLLWLNQPDRESYGAQLKRLEDVTPYDTLALAEHSIRLAQQRWPQDVGQSMETRRWRAVLTPYGRDKTIPDNGYAIVQRRLQHLSEELLEQERTRGGLTISYLKTAIYQMQNALNGDVPLEELLRRLDETTRNGEPASVMLLKQINDRWSLLTGQYYRLVHNSEVAASDNN